MENRIQWKTGSGSVEGLFMFCRNPPEHPHSKQPLHICRFKQKEHILILGHKSNQLYHRRLSYISYKHSFPISPLVHCQPQVGLGVLPEFLSPRVQRSVSLEEFEGLEDRPYDITPFLISLSSRTPPSAGTSLKSPEISQCRIGDPILARSTHAAG